MPEPYWTRLELAVPNEAIDAVSAICIELGAPGVVTGQRDLRRESKAKTRTRRSTRLEAYFPPEIARRSLERRLKSGLERARAEFPGIELKRLRLDAFVSKDYSASLRDDFPPVPVGKHLLIVPSWHDPGDTRRIAVRIDPGQAFGTGHHPTTRGCLLEIERACEDSAPARGLDVGCGSGVLAIAMRKLGVRRVTAIDTDPIARQAAEQAVRDNGSEPVRIAASLGAVRGRFELIAANLFANLLSDLAPALVARLAPGGCLIVSGLLEKQERRVRSALAAEGLRVRTRRSLSSWVTLACSASGKD